MNESNLKLLLVLAADHNMVVQFFYVLFDVLLFVVMATKNAVNSMNSQFSGFVAPLRVHIRTHGPRLKADPRLELQSRTAFIEVFICFFFWRFLSQIALIELVWSDEKNGTAFPVILSVILNPLSS